MGAMPEAVRPIDVIRVHGTVRTEDADRAAVEEPLEIRLHGRPFAVVMRTPGNDRELAAGFLLSEDVLSGPDDLSAMASCQDAENVLNVTLVGNVVGRLDARGAAAVRADGWPARRRLFAPDGRLETVAEDVGRHNAVDKVVGRMLLAETFPIANRVLCVSGRASFEIVQKAYLAGIPVVASVSPPSSLAIDLARDLGLTLVGFVRRSAFNVYSHSERIS